LDEPDDDRYARAPEPADVVRICRSLNDAGARYLLIGGFAVIAHGAGRFTKDIDLLLLLGSDPRGRPGYRSTPVT
jgi:hypothetical protein